MRRRRVFRSWRRHLVLSARLDQFKIPVAIDVPDETVDRICCVVELVGFDRRRHVAPRFRGLMRDPAVQRFLGVVRIEVRIAGAAVDLGKARGVPELGREIAVALDALRRKLDIAPLRAMAASVKRKASAPYSSISASGSITLPFDFDILAPLASRTSAWM